MSSYRSDESGCRVYGEDISVRVPFAGLQCPTPPDRAKDHNHSDPAHTLAAHTHTHCSRTQPPVGNLPMDVNERELDDLFYKYGRILDIHVKRPNRPPAFGFVTFDDPRDASDAVSCESAG